MRFPKSRSLLGLFGSFGTAGSIALLSVGSSLALDAKAGLAPTSPHAILEKTSEAFHSVAEKAVPSVVSISALKRAAPPTLPGMPAGPGGGMPGGGAGVPGGGDPSNPFGGRGLGIGSGVIIRADGMILTSHHLVENAERVTVILPGPNAGTEPKPGTKPVAERKVDATIVGIDPRSDLAVLKLKEKIPNLAVMQFADSDQVKVGDWAIAVGSPFGLSHTVTSGIVSAKGRASMGVFDIEDFIQTDAAINPGNSGGPLLNIQGQMIGINAAIFSQSGGFIGIGFSIPSNLARQVSDELIEKGKVVRGWMGVVAQDLDEDLSKYFKVEPGNGALISQVASKGPAEEGKLKTGDVVTRFGSQPITDSGQLRALVAKSKIGGSIDVLVQREGTQKQLSIKIAEQPPLTPPPAQMAGTVSKKEEKNDGSFGMTVQDLPPELKEMLGSKGKNAEGALVVNVQPGSHAFDSGLAPGDIILRANQDDIDSAASFARFAHKKLKHEKEKDEKDPVVLYIQRGPDERLFVPVKS